MTAAAKTKIAEFARSRTAFRRRMKMKLKKASSAQRLEALRSAGIITKQGKLAREYRDY